MATVTKQFIDAKTGKLYFAGDTYKGTRTEELSALGFVAVASTPKKSKKESADVRED